MRVWERGRECEGDGRGSGRGPKTGRRALRGTRKKANADNPHEFGRGRMNSEHRQCLRFRTRNAEGARESCGGGGGDASADTFGVM